MSEILDSPGLHDVECNEEENGDTNVSADVSYVVVEICLDVGTSSDNRVPSSGSRQRASLIRPKNCWVFGEISNVIGNNISPIACKTS